MLRAGLLAVRVGPVRERAAPLEPGLLVVPSVQEHVRPFVRSHHTLDRVPEQPVLFGIEAVLHHFLGGSQVVERVVLGQPAEPDLDVPVERDVLVQVGLVPHLARVNIAVHDQPPDARREQGRVDLAQIGAVGEPVVADLAAAQRLPDAVHVPDRVHRGHVVQQGRLRGAVRGAPLVVPGAAREPVVQDLLGPRVVVLPVPPEVVRRAGYRRNTGADAARIEPDPVIVRDRGLVRGRALRLELGDQEDVQVQATAARATRVGQDDTLVLRGARGVLDPRDGDLDRRPRGVAVIERHGQHGARRAGLPQVTLGASSPLQGAGRGRGGCACHGRRGDAEPAGQGTGSGGYG